MADLSVRNQSNGAQRIADAMMRATGGFTAVLMMPPAQADTTDAGQLGLNVPGYQQLTLSPVIFRQQRRLLTAGEPARYELHVSATAVEAQVGQLGLASADALFGQVAAVQVAGIQALLEEWSSTVSLGEPIFYQLLLQACEPESLTGQS
jgi:hypothetical protein